jgi:hypothetical protein
VVVLDEAPADLRIRGGGDGLDALVAAVRRRSSPMQADTGSKANAFARVPHLWNKVATFF